MILFFCSSFLPCGARKRSFGFWFRYLQNNHLEIRNVGLKDRKENTAGNKDLTFKGSMEEKGERGVGEKGREERQGEEGGGVRRRRRNQRPKGEAHVE